jgi:hypothetical protein
VLLLLAVLAVLALLLALLQALVPALLAVVACLMSLLTARRDESSYPCFLKRSKSDHGLKAGSSLKHRPPQSSSKSTFFNTVSSSTKIRNSTTRLGFLRE